MNPGLILILVQELNYILILAQKFKIGFFFGSKLDIVI